MSPQEQTARAVLSELAGREAIAVVAPLLQRAGVAVMPLKGAWLQACVRGQAGVRAITDVDLLVRESQFTIAIDALVQGGFHARARHTASEQTLEHPALSLPVDLHCRLFTRGAFRLPTAALFERARPDTKAFGVPLLLPDPCDVFAHLVGHFVKSRVRQDDDRRLADFAAIAEHCDLDASALAGHLHAAGMGRAARYVLHQGAHIDDNPFYRTLIDALPDDPVGERVALAARFLARRAIETRASGLGALPGFLLDRSLGAGALSLLLRVYELALEPARRA